MIIEMKRSGILISFIIFQAAVLHAQQVTYYKDVEPIVISKCAPCHRPEESAPFPLLTYNDVKKRASFIREVVSSGYMPPWKPDNRYVHFTNDRSLTPQEKNTILKWVKSGAVAGTPSANKPEQASFVEGTMYGRKPDVVLTATDSFLVKGDGAERFVVFKIPFELPDSANVEAVEFFSNDKKLVHHANYAVHAVPDTSIDIRSTASFINLTEDDRQKFDQYQPYRKTITYYGGWIPGTTYESYPDDIGWIMPRRGVILLTVHFAPASLDQQSINGVNLFFKSTPVKRHVKVISFGSGGIGEKDIRPSFYLFPNDKKTFRLDVMNPGEDFSIMYVWPHMHYLGKEFKAYILTPNGDTTRLVSIPDWDFRWQEIYRFRKLMVAPRGSVLHIEGYYDNSAENPFNPSHPPKFISSTGDMKSTDEMLTLMMVFLPYQKGDENLVLDDTKR
jgi:hypothetical protein